MLNVMRWLAVLPGAIVCAFLALFPLHLVLYQTLTGSGIVEPYPEAPERLLGPLVSALAFVWGGSRIAPLRKVETAVVLFGVLLLLIGASVALGLIGAHVGNVRYFLPLGGLPPAGAIVGAFVGLYLVCRERTGDLNAKLPV
jgi:hypothetical protein